MARSLRHRLEGIDSDITNPRVLAALREVPRHEFVPLELRLDAYRDKPLPIGHRQTISQPYIVALMTQALDPQPTDRILEVGTGSGYQAAILSRLVHEVFTIEIIEELALRACANLSRLHYDNVHVRHGDGHRGWPAAAPFDGIIVTCAPEEIPPVLQEELREGGRMVLPVGSVDSDQELNLLRKENGQLQRQSIRSVRFVPMTGTPGW